MNEQADIAGRYADAENAARRAAASTPPAQMRFLLTNLDPFEMA